jgi:hypothetical protein
VWKSHEQSAYLILEEPADGGVQAARPICRHPSPNASLFSQQ